MDQLIRYVIVAGNPAIGSSSDSGSNEMLSEKSVKILKENKRISKDETDNLECTIKVRQSTIDALKELAYRHNLGTYDNAIAQLVTFYNKYVDKELMH